MDVQQFENISIGATLSALTGVPVERGAELATIATKIMNEVQPNKSAEYLPIFHRMEQDHLRSRLEREFLVGYFGFIMGAQSIATQGLEGILSTIKAHLRNDD